MRANDRCLVGPIQRHSFIWPKPRQFGGLLDLRIPLPPQIQPVQSRDSSSSRRSIGAPSRSHHIRRCTGGEPPTTAAAAASQAIRNNMAAREAWEPRLGGQTSSSSFPSGSNETLRDRCRGARTLTIRSDHTHPRPLHSIHELQLQLTRACARSKSLASLPLFDLLYGVRAISLPHQFSLLLLYLYVTENSLSSAEMYRSPRGLEHESFKVRLFIHEGFWTFDKGPGACRNGLSAMHIESIRRQKHPKTQSLSLSILFAYSMNEKLWICAKLCGDYSWIKFRDWRDWITTLRLRLAYLLRSNYEHFSVQKKLFGIYVQECESPSWWLW